MELLRDNELEVLQRRVAYDRDAAAYRCEESERLPFLGSSEHSFPLTNACRIRTSNKTRDGNNL